MSAARPRATAPVETVLFDLDGTLSDSAPGILGALRFAFAENGLEPLDEQTERSLLGPPFYESLPPLIGGAHRLADVIEAYRNHYGQGAMFDTTVYEGIAEVVTAARAAGLQLAVATSKPESYAGPIVEHLGLAGYFTTVGGDELDGSRGTKALVIEEVLSRLGRPDLATVLMVGDRSHDVEGARAHGIVSVGAAWGYGMPGELIAAAPLAICARPRDLLDVLGLDGSDRPKPRG